MEPSKNAEMIKVKEMSCECLDCGKKFQTFPKLRRHQITHNEDKPFSCETCSKGFSDKSNLQRHQLIHTGEKPFS